jgi:regulator of sigma E protease
MILRLYKPHYFLGFNSKLFNVRWKHIKFTVGIYIPFPGLSRTYVVTTDKKILLNYATAFPESSAWKKFLIPVSGLMALFVTALISVSILIYGGKESFISKSEVNKYGIEPSRLAATYGFKSGDKVLAINGNDFESYTNLLDPEIFMKEGSFYTIMREGKEVRIDIGAPSEAFEYKQERFLSIKAPFEVAQVAGGSAAERSGLQAGDRILKVEGVTITTIIDLRRELEKIH